jgi:hypothetical protein
MAVGGDHLLLLDACGTECRRQPATRMLPRGPVIAVAHVQRRLFAVMVFLQLTLAVDRRGDGVVEPARGDF